uniref:Uncharacterized protein n=1 Tax=Glossina brevipalpis TaxID=37001 RepID=A0A1A9WVZ2_9MUSC
MNAISTYTMHACMQIYNLISTRYCTVPYRTSNGTTMLVAAIKAQHTTQNFLTSVTIVREETRNKSKKLERIFTNFAKFILTAVFWHFHLVMFGKFPNLAKP